MPARPDRPELPKFSIPTPATNYTRIPHEFIDRALRVLNGSEVGVYLAICRLTLGWNRPEWTGKSYEICDLAGIHHTSFHEAIRRLEELELILVDRDPGRTSTYAIRFAGDMVPPRKSGGVPATNPPGKAGGYPPGKAEGSADSVLIEGVKENIKERDNPPTPLPEQNAPDMEQRIDHWAAAEARSHGVTLKINTGKKREALTEADCPELREQIAALIRTGSGDVTPDVLRLVGFGGKARSSGGMERQPFRPSYGRIQQITTGPKVDTALQESPLCREIVACRNDAEVLPRTGDWLNMPPWKVAVLDAMRLRDKDGFHKRLTEAFRTHAEDYKQGVSSDAIVESFFTTEQQRSKQSKGGFDDIREYIESLSA